MQRDVIILGAGAIGLALVGAFRKSGLNVGVVAREKLVNSIKKNGLRLVSENIYFLKEDDKLKFYSDVDPPINNLKNDGLIIITSKTPDLISIINSYLPAVYNPNSRQNILVIQNGLNPEEKVLKILLEKYPGKLNNLVGGIIMGRSEITDYDFPTVKYELSSIFIGSWYTYNREKKAAILKVVSEFLYDKNIFDTVAYGNQDEYRMQRYMKAIANGANVISALFGVKVGEIVDNPFLWDAMKDKITESVSVAQADNVYLDLPDTLKKSHKVYDEIVRDHYTSMKQDIDIVLHNPGRRLITEIDDLDLAFAKKGEQYGVVTPLNIFYGYLMCDLTKSYNYLVEMDASKANKFMNDFIGYNQSAINLDDTLSKNLNQLGNTNLHAQVYSNLSLLKEENEIPETDIYIPQMSINS